MGNIITQRLGITMPCLNQPMRKFADLAELAEHAGFDSVWGYEWYNNMFVTQGQAAVCTRNITLGIGLAVAAQRTPFEMANAAADVDELSGGRLSLAVSTGGGSFTEYFNGVDIDRPASRIREYIHVMRIYWEYLRTGEPVEYKGEFYRFGTPPFNSAGSRILLRPEVPIHIGALRPAMLRLAGEKADGAIGYFQTPGFIKRDVLPHIAEGAMKAGRDPAEIDLATYVICCVSHDPAIALRLARIQVGAYACVPMNSFISEREGLVEDRDAVIQAVAKDGFGVLEHVTSDALVEKFAIVGTPEQAREQLAAYQKVIPHVVLHTPYMPPLTVDECEQAFRNIVAAFGRN